MTLKSLVLIAAFSFVVSGWLATQPSSPLETVFHAHADSLIASLKIFQHDVAGSANGGVLKKDFLHCRIAYKRASALTDYFFPSLRREINGPDLRYAEDDNPDSIHEPHGFQVIESILYSPPDSGYRLRLNEEITRLSGTFESINNQPELSYKLRPELVADAVKSAIIRLVSLGITGFDSPLALQSIPEGMAVLDGLQDIVVAMEMNELIQPISHARRFLQSSGHFNDLDRLKFIKEFADPLYQQLTTTFVSSGLVLPAERTPLNQFATSIFSDSLFQLSFFSPNSRYQVTPQRVLLGKQLFYDSILSPTSRRTCASCHNPARAFTDGLITAKAISPTGSIKRNSPTLLASAWQTKYFYDSRASTLENQLNSVVHNVDEMNGSLRNGIEKIVESESYSRQFKEAYPNESQPVTEYNIANAISSYVRSLSSLNTRFDRYMRGQEKLTPNEIKGFNLFTGKAKCATCHFMPLFNGLVPPYFTETESEILGVPASRKLSVIDDDLGKFNFTRSNIHRHAFKTPTLRNISHTAPYMHNGVFETLNEVMVFYNKGGGAGLGIRNINQTLQPDPLHLSNTEMRNVIAFLKTLE